MKETGGAAHLRDDPDRGRLLTAVKAASKTVVWAKGLQAGSITEKD
jgi:hypothetical protein